MKARSSLLLLPGLALAGCSEMHFGSGEPGNGKLKTSARSVSAFHAVSLEGAADITIVVGGKQSVSIETDSNLLEKVTTTVSDGELVVKTKSIKPTKLKVTITVPNLDAVAMSGAGDIDVKGISAPKFSGSIDGAGNISLHGRASSVSLSMNGAGEIDAVGLESSAAAATVDGAGSITVWAKSSLNASVNGVGSIEYKGDPKLTKSVSGVGSVSKI